MEEDGGRWREVEGGGRRWRGEEGGRWKEMEGGTGVRSTEGPLAPGSVEEACTSVLR